MRALGGLCCIAAAAGCTGIITEPVLTPVGTGWIPDAPACPQQVLAGTPGAQWAPAGPPGASVHALLPLGSGALLVGTGLSRSSGVMVSRSAAIYRSSDRGRTVTEVLDLPGSSVEALVNVQGTVYAGVTADPAGGGVWSSTDRGATFAAASTGLHMGAQVIQLSVAAGSAPRVYALVRGTPSAPQTAATSLYRKDGTGDWTLLDATGLNPDPGGPLGGIAADPASADRIYAVDGNRLYRSDDAGQTFTTLASTFYAPTGLANVRRLVAVADGSATQLLIGTVELGLLETHDEGQTFNALLPGDLSSYPAVLDIAPGGGLLATEGSGLLRVQDTRPIGQCLLDKVVVTVAKAPDEDVVWAGTNGGLQLSTDGAQTFETVGAGLSELVGKVTVVSIAGEPVAFLMTSAGLYRYSPAAGAWERQGDWASTIGFSDLSVSADGRTGFVSVDEGLFPGQYGASGSVWQWKLVEHLVQRVDGIAGDVGAVATSSGGAFAYQRGDDVPFTGVMVRQGTGAFAASTMESTSLATSSAFRFAPLAVAPDGTLYAGARLMDGSPALLRSSDSGGTHQQVWSLSGWITYGVWVDPQGSVWLTGSQGDASIRKSTDRGQTFAKFDDGLDGFGKLTYALGFGPGGLVVAGTEGGPYLAADGTHFVALTDGFTKVPSVWSVAVLPADPKPIVLAATSQGIFWRTLP
jgi:hypothetical protein